MKLHYYPETDSLYIDLTDEPASESQEVRPGIVLDFSAEGRLVGSTSVARPNALP